MFRLKNTFKYFYQKSITWNSYFKVTTLPAIDVDAFSLSRSSAYKELYFRRKILKADVDVSTHHYFIVVVVVVDDDTYYWVYLSSDHLFQVYCKVRQLFDYKVRWSVITKCDSFSITKCDRYYRVWQFYYKVQRLLQSATVHRLPV